MSTRRERAKAQNLQLNKQLESKVAMPKERREQVVELGKFFIDLAKLMEIKIGNMELVYIYSAISVLALVGIIWLQIKMRKDRRGIL